MLSNFALIGIRLGDFGGMGHQLTLFSIFAVIVISEPVPTR